MVLGRTSKQNKEKYQLQRKQLTEFTSKIFKYLYENSISNVSRIGVVQKKYICLI